MFDLDSLGVYFNFGLDGIDIPFGGSGHRDGFGRGYASTRWGDGDDLCRLRGEAVKLSDIPDAKMLVVARCSYNVRQQGYSISIELQSVYSETSLCTRLDSVFPGRRLTIDTHPAQLAAPAFILHHPPPCPRPAAMRLPDVEVGDTAKAITEPYFVPVGSHIKVVDQDIVVWVRVEGKEFGGGACGEVKGAEGTII